LHPWCEGGGHVAYRFHSIVQHQGTIIMTPHKKRSCKLTRRLAEDMTIRNMAPATIDAYTYHVRRFADFIQKPLDRVSA